MNSARSKRYLVGAVSVLLLINIGMSAEADPASTGSVRYKTVKIDGLDIFYREAMHRSFMRTMM